MNFVRCCYGLLIYTLIVILWGAWVRISRSGDGCGESWPLCNEQLIPTGATLPTWIEFSHRLSSGLYGILVFALFVYAWRKFPKKHVLRKATLSVLVLTITEALVGAGLVLKGLVGDNASVARAYVMGLHMMNSLLLVASLQITHQLAENGRVWNASVRQKVIAAFLLIGFMVICAAGAIAALAGTLFPSESLIEGLLADLSHSSHFLVRLRVWHPIAATSIGLGLFAFVASLYFDSQEGWRQKQARRVILGLFIALVFGYSTLFALSPVWMKLTHLLIAHLMWMELIKLFMPMFRRR